MPLRLSVFLLILLGFTGKMCEGKKTQRIQISFRLFLRFLPERRSANAKLEIEFVRQNVNQSFFYQRFFISFHLLRLIWCEIKYNFLEFSFWVKIDEIEVKTNALYKYFICVCVFLDEFILDGVVNTNEVLSDADAATTHARPFDESSFSAVISKGNSVGLHNAYIAVGTFATAIFIVAIVVSISVLVFFWFLIL